MPCTAHHLLRYVVFLTRTLASSSIPCYLNIVRILHLQHGFPNPLEEPLFKNQKTLLMRGIMRINSKAVSQKLPITPAILILIFEQLDLTVSLDATFWAPCLVAFSPFFVNQTFSYRLLQHSTHKNICAEVTYISLNGASCFLFADPKLFNIVTAHFSSHFPELSIPNSAHCPQLCTHSS